MFCDMGIIAQRREGLVVIRDMKIVVGQKVMAPFVGDIRLFLYCKYLHKQNRANTLD